MSGGSTISSPGSSSSRSQARGQAKFEREIGRSLDDAGLVACNPLTLLLATSGGADSTALLLALDNVRRSAELSTKLVACYIDHGLRAAGEIGTEKRRLAEICAGLGVALHTISVDVRAERLANHRSWEDAARRCRYAALGELCLKLGAQAVVTGHTADDQAETVLMRILRGTGLRGLRGMAAIGRPWGSGGPLLIRPLLVLGRAETEAYCRARGVEWSSDSSNLSVRFTRNRVRRELLPALRTLYPGAPAALRRLAAQAGELGLWLDTEVDAVIDARWSMSETRALLARGDVELHPFLRAQVAATVIARLLKAPGPPSQRLVAAVVDLWTGRTGRRLAVGGGWFAVATYAGVAFERKAAGALGDDLRWRKERWALGPGTTELSGWRVTLTASTAPPVQGFGSAEDGDAFVAFLPEARFTGEQLSVRYWQPGARMMPAGMTQEKKLQDIFVDEKVPRSQRRQLPLLYLGERCIWMPGVKRSALAPPRSMPDEPSLYMAFERIEVAQIAANAVFKASRRVD